MDQLRMLTWTMQVSHSHSRSADLVQTLSQARPKWQSKLPKVETKGLIKGRRAIAAQVDQLSHKSKVVWETI